ncbi:MAG: hypothetical protein J0G32_05155 [Alphaproteobacteria bacterium]|nr:hypothetical protein [Alphaproteobacteria bacterium]OJV15316.1 MAG: hypothetical protein BGO27_02275 [Alphaproteobacteria bacterium 33-17]
MYSISDFEFKFFKDHFWILQMISPEIGASSDAMVENIIEIDFNSTNPNSIKSLKEIYYIFQKFLRNYNLQNPPSQGSWHKFLYDEVDRWSDTEEEAYEWVCDIAKIYARKLRERGLITSEEESHLFTGSIVHLKEEDKWALKGYDIEP